MPSARCCSTPASVTVLPSAVVMSPPVSAACSCAPVGLVMPCLLSENGASASECETLPQPIGFVGGVNVVVVMVVTSSTVVVYVRVTGVPVRNAVASATAFSVEPAIVVNGAANLSATRTWPGDMSVAVGVGAAGGVFESLLAPSV